MCISIHFICVSYFFQVQEVIDLNINTAIEQLNSKAGVDLLYTCEFRHPTFAFLFIHQLVQSKQFVKSFIIEKHRNIYDIFKRNLPNI